MANIGKVEGSITLRDEFSSQLEVAATKLDAFGGKAQRIGGQVQSVGRGLLPISAGLAAAAVAGLSFSTDLGRGMANVASLIPGNTARVAELKGEVQELAIAHGKPVQDLVGGLYQTISAFGDDAAQTTKILEINSRAATAGVAETSDAIRLTSGVTKAYGDTSADAVQQVSDLALATVRMGQTTFPELAAAMGRVTPIAESLGQSQEDLFAVFATGTGVTGSTKEVATQYRGVLAALLSPTESLTTLIEKQGFASGKAMLEQQGLVGTLQNIVAAAEASGEPITNYVSQIEAVPLALALAGPQADTFREKLADLGDVSGEVDAAFREQTEGINEAGFKWDQAKQRMAAMAVALGDGLAPALIATLDAAEPLIGWATSAIQWFGDLPAPIQAVGLALGGILVAGPPLLIFAGKLVVAVGSVATAMGLKTAAIAADTTATVANTAAQQANAAAMTRSAGAAGGLGAAVGKAGLVAGVGALSVAIGHQLQQFADWREETDSLIGKHNLWFDMLSSDVLADWIDSVGGYGESLDGLNSSAAETARLHAEMPTAIDRMNSAASDANVQLAAMAEAGNEVGFRYTVLDGELRKVDMTTRKLIPVVAAVGDEVDDLGNSGGDAAPKISDLEKALSSLGFVTGTSVTTELDALTLAVTDGQTPVVQLQGKITELMNRYRELGLLTPEVEARLSALNEKVGGWGFVASEAAKGTEDWKDTFIDFRPKAAEWGTVMDSNVDAMTSFWQELEIAEQRLQETRKAGDGFFSSMLKGIPIIGDLSGKLGGFLDNLFGGGGGDGGIGGFIGKLFGGGGGGGGLMDMISGALGGIGGKVSGAFSSILGSAMSGGLTAALGPLGPLVSAGISKLGGLALKGLKALGGKIWGGLKSLFGGPDAAELAGRDTAAAFRDTLTGILDDVQRAETGTDQWAQEVVALRDSFLAVGKTEAEALAISEQLWKAEKEGPEAVKAVIAQISPVLDEVQAAMASTGMTLTDLRNEAINASNRLGISVSEAFQAIADGTIDTMQAATDATADQVAEAEAGYKESLDAIKQAQQMLTQATSEEAVQQATAMLSNAKIAANEWQNQLDILKGKTDDAAAHVGDSLVRAADNIRDSFSGMDFEVPVRFATEGFRPGGGGGGVVEVDVPHLAQGGIVTKPTLAMIGEGNKAEGVFPLDRFFGGSSGAGGFRDGEPTRLVLTDQGGRVIARVVAEEAEGHR